MAKKSKRDLNLLQNHPDVPKGGWLWYWMYDYEQGYVKCEYCGQYPVRYLHILRHPYYPDFIHVGSDCAAILTGTPFEDMRGLETDFKRYCAARDRFNKNIEWKTNAKGNLVASYTFNRIPCTLTIVKSKHSPCYAVACNSKFATKIKSDDFVNIVDITDLQQAQKIAFDLVYNKVCMWNMIVWENVKNL